MKYLITGGCGFLGSNLANECLARGHDLFILDNLSRAGSEKNLEWLKTKGSFAFYNQDTRDANKLNKAIIECKPDVIFHLAGQVAMTTSLANPRLDFETNVLGGFNLLEAVRLYAPDAIVTYSSSNKVYGDLDDVEYKETPTRYTAEDFPSGFDESIKLNFHSPYGCSKGAVDQYMLDYARLFGVRAIVFRHSTIFGGRQFATFDQGWIGWFVSQAIQLKAGKLRDPFTISGTGKQVRDILFASDLASCYFKAVEGIDRSAGQAFNIGGGVENSLSLLELFSFLEEELDIRMIYKQLPWRASDQKIFIANTKKARDLFGFDVAIDKVAGLRKMVEWVSNGGR